MKKLILVILLISISFFVWWGFFALGGDGYFVYFDNQKIAEKLIIAKIEKDKRDDIEVSFLSSDVSQIGLQTGKGEFLKYNPDAKNYKIYWYEIAYKIDSKDYEVYNKKTNKYTNVPYGSKIEFIGKVSLYINGEVTSLIDIKKYYVTDLLGRYIPERIPKIPYRNSDRRIEIFFPGNISKLSDLILHPDRDSFKTKL